LEITQPGGGVGIPGLYVIEDPGASDEEARDGNLSMKFGLGWAKAMSFRTGQTPAMGYHRQLMQAILYDKVDIGKAVNVTPISLDESPKGYEEFDSGVDKKFVIDPHAVPG